MLSVETTGQDFQPFLKIWKIQNFTVVFTNIWIQHKKFIQISTILPIYYWFSSS